MNSIKRIFAALGIRAVLAFSTRLSAAKALGHFGTEAKDAIPALIKLFQEDSDASSNLVIGEALKTIDPETAAKVGVE
jgi:HEAT repeat protein